MTELLAVLSNPITRPYGSDGIAALLNPQEVSVTANNLTMEGLQAIIATRTACDICKRPESPLYPDIDAELNVRGVLCSACLAALRGFRHAPAILAAAAAYVDSPAEDEPGEIWSATGPLDTYPWGDR